MPARQGRATPLAWLVLVGLCLPWLIPIVIAGPAAYAFTFLDLPGRRPLFALVVGLLIVPNQVALAPLLRIYGDLGLTGEYASVYLTHVGFGMPLAIFIFAISMATLPVALIDAAKVDGASHWQVVTGAAIITMAVPVLVFVTLQRSFIRGLTAGSING